MLSALLGWRWHQQQNDWLQEASNYLFHFSKTKLKYDILFILFFFVRKVNQRYAFSCWKKMYAALVSGLLFWNFSTTGKMDARSHCCTRHSSCIFFLRNRHFIHTRVIKNKENFYQVQEWKKKAIKAQKMLKIRRKWKSSFFSNEIY